MNKYYTPTIEEFHVGFEYEEYVRKQWFEDTIEESDICNGEFELLYEQLVLHNDLIRVKYLNKDDIESLGWLRSGLSNSMFIYEDKLDLYGRGDTLGIGLNFNTGHSHVLMFLIDSPNVTPASNINLFVGSIKNKSELHKLMKQLNIIQ